MKKEMIALSGEIASGKGTVGKIISKTLGYEIYSASMVFRQMAREKNMSITDFGKYVEERPELDLETEKRMGEYAKANSKVILDGRMAFYVAPFAFKVYMKVDTDVAAERMFNDNRGKEDSYDTLEETKASIIDRYENENTRYMNVYNVNKADESNYDLVFDTTGKSPEECAKIILDAFQIWLNN
ncbi:MAG: cytidylate kinase family protein [Clostridia bacterium]